MNDKTKHPIVAIIESLERVILNMEDREVLELRSLAFADAQIMASVALLNEVQAVLNNPSLATPHSLYCTLLKLVTCTQLLPSLASQEAGVRTDQAWILRGRMTNELEQLKLRWTQHMAKEAMQESAGVTKQ